MKPIPEGQPVLKLVHKPGFPFQQIWTSLTYICEHRTPCLNEEIHQWPKTNFTLKQKEQLLQRKKRKCISAFLGSNALMTSIPPELNSFSLLRPQLCIIKLLNIRKFPSFCSSILVQPSWVESPFHLCCICKTKSTEKFSTQSWGKCFARYLPLKTHYWKLNTPVKWLMTRTRKCSFVTA